MRPTARGKLSTSSKKVPPSQILEQEARQMEEKLKILKRQMANEKQERENNSVSNNNSQMNTSQSRWAAASTSKPLKNYSNNVLDEKNQYLNSGNGLVEGKKKLSATASFRPSNNNSNRNLNATLGGGPGIRSNSKGNYTGTLAQPRGSFKNSQQQQSPAVLTVKRPSSSTNLKQAPLRKISTNNLVSQLQSQDNSLVQEYESPAISTKSEATKASKNNNNSNNTLNGIVQPQQITTNKQQQQQQQQKQAKNGNSIAGNNLQKHLESQKQEEKDHLEFLKDLNLLQYRGRFEENGFDDLDAIIELNTELLNSMMIPAGHQIKIMKKVDKIRKEKNLDPASNEGHILQQYSTQKKPTNLVALEYNEEEEAENKYGKQHSIAVGNETHGDGSTGLTQQKAVKQSEFDGVFDEKASHESFLEALMEFRGGKKQTKNNEAIEEEEQEQEENKKKARKKSVRFSESVVDNEKKSHSKDNEKKKGLFFMMGGATNFNNDNYNIPQNQDGEMQTGSENNPQIPVTEKTSCWECYTVFPVSKQIESMGYSFCSQKCFDACLKAQSISCANQKCRKQMIKKECVIKNGEWFCSEKCAPSLEQMLIAMKDGKKGIVEKNENVELNNEEILDLERSFVKIREEKQRVQNDHKSGGGILDLATKNNYGSRSGGGAAPKILTLEELESKYKSESESKVQGETEEYQSKQQDEEEILADSLDPSYFEKQKRRK